MHESDANILRFFNVYCGIRDGEIMAEKIISVNFEKSLAELEQLVEKMEKGDLSLEESVKSFEKGIALTRACQAALAEAEQKVQILLDNDNDSELDTFKPAG